MKRYTYRILDDDFSSQSALLRGLNELGAEGWQVIRGSFRDHFDSMAGVDTIYTVKVKFLLMREIEEG